MAERNIRLTIEYDGRGFHGWQKQPALRTVQGELEGALATILRHAVTLHAAGRTDAGVHALAQVANFHTTSSLATMRIRRGVNALAGGDVIVTSAAEAPHDFDARHSAVARHYIYLMLTRRSALWAGRATRLLAPVDVEQMNAVCSQLAGRHDFAGFSCRGDEEADTDSEVLYARWETWPRGIGFRIGAARFLYKMVRCIVAASLEVGAGRWTSDDFSKRLASPTGRAQLVAAADGLYLVGADYDERPAGGLDCLPPWPVL